MKSKPDVSGFVPKRDPVEFLEGGAADRAERSVEAPLKATPTAPIKPDRTARPEPTVQKLFRLRWDIANALKADAQKQTAEGKHRVTETEIIEKMLRERYGINLLDS